MVGDSRRTVGGDAPQVVIVQRRGRGRPRGSGRPRGTVQPRGSGQPRGRGRPRGSGRNSVSRHQIITDNLNIQNIEDPTNGLPIGMPLTMQTNGLWYSHPVTPPAPQITSLVSLVGLEMDVSGEGTSNVTTETDSPAPNSRVCPATHPVTLPAPQIIPLVPLVDSQMDIAEEGTSNVAVEVDLPPNPVSPATFMQCASNSADSTPSKTDNKKIDYDVDYGSELESGESESEELAAPVIPRSLLVGVDGPDDEDAETLPITGIGPCFYDFQWTPLPTPPISRKLRREPFSDINVGPITPCVDPYDTFLAIWDKQIMEHIALETNRYAQELAQRFLKNNDSQSEISAWYDTTPDELYVFFAVTLAMGVVIKTKLEEYWSTSSDIFMTPGFSIQMSIERFRLLSRCLHFINNEEMRALELDVTEAKIFKIKPLLSHLNEKFQRLYNLRQNIAIDESLMQCKGWLNINHLLPHKAPTVGIKTYELCEPQTGYLWRFIVRSQKKVRQEQQTTNQDPLDRVTPKIVLRLLQGLENKGHTLWMDSFYNSPALARKLKTLGFDCVGTLRTNRQFMPQALKNLTRSNMRAGEVTGYTSGDVDVLVWRDINIVGGITTYHGNAVATRAGTIKPFVILDYNLMMSGVDKKDQMLAMYPIERKRTKVWYKKLFYRLLNVSVLNAHILCKESSSSLEHRPFRISLIKSLLLEHSSSTLIPPDLTNQTQETPIFEVKDHHLAEYPFLPGKSERLRRLCYLCKKRVRTYCVGCNETVCMTPCFSSLHEMQLQCQE